MDLGGGGCGYLLDTTVLVDHAQGRAGATEVLERLFSETNELLVCDVVVTEALSKGPDEEMLVIGSLIRAMEYVATHPEAARWAGELADGGVVRSGPRSLADAIIAGVAHRSRGNRRDAQPARLRDPGRPRPRLRSDRGLTAFLPALGQRPLQRGHHDVRAVAGDAQRRLHLEHVVAVPGRLDDHAQRPASARRSRGPPPRRAPVSRGRGPAPRPGRGPCRGPRRRSGGRRRPAPARPSGTRPRPGHSPGAPPGRWSRGPRDPPRTPPESHRCWRRTSPPRRTRPRWRGW